MVLFPGKCAGTAADDDNDEWIMFQLCGDAKSVPFTGRYRYGLGEIRL